MDKKVNEEVKKVDNLPSNLFSGTKMAYVAFVLAIIFNDVIAEAITLKWFIIISVAFVLFWMFEDHFFRIVLNAWGKKCENKILDKK